MIVIIEVELHPIQKYYAKKNNEYIPIVDNSQKIFDYADLLTSNQEENLLKQINDYINTQKMDMIIVTIDKNNLAPTQYADDFYDFNDFGIGFDKKGLLFLIDMQNREIRISTTGKAIDVYSDLSINNILDYVYDKIKSNNYYGCIEEFIDKANTYANIYANYNINKNTIKSLSVYNLKSNLKYSMIISIFLTIVSIYKGYSAHKNVKIKKDANDFAVYKLTYDIDKFLNENVTKHRIETESSSSRSGSSTHTSSSGITHGGGGRSF